MGLEHGVVRNREWRIWKGEWLTGESGMDNREWGKLQGGNGELEIREWGIRNKHFASHLFRLLICCKNFPYRFFNGQMYQDML